MKAVRPFLPMELRCRFHMAKGSRRSYRTRGHASTAFDRPLPRYPWLRSRIVASSPALTPRARASPGLRFALPEVDLLLERTRLEGSSTAPGPAGYRFVACKVCGCQRGVRGGSSLHGVCELSPRQTGP